MLSTPVAVLLLSAQRYQLEGQPHEREIVRNWTRHLEVAREVGQLVVLIQWDGTPDTPGETFGKGWILHPDFRAEEGDLMLRAQRPDAFATSDLLAELQARAVRELIILTLKGDEAGQVMNQRAIELGYIVNVFEEDVQ